MLMTAADCYHANIAELIKGNYFRMLIFVQLYKTGVSQANVQEIAIGKSIKLL